MRLSLPLAPQHRVFAAFAVYSFALGNIFPRLPDIKMAMDVEEGALGLSLIGTSVGTLLSLSFATPLVERIGFRRTLLVAVPLLAVLYFIVVWAPNPLSLFLLLIPAGLVIGAIEIIINTEADRTEHAIGFRIMNRAHAFWSLGFFGAGLFGSWMAQLGLSPQMHLALVIPMALIATVLFLGGYEPAPHRAGTSIEKAPRFAAPSLAILVLVAVTLSAMILEGAAMDWSAIYMDTLFDPGPFLTGIAVATCALSQATMRFFADGIVERYSPAGVSRVLLALLFVGVLVVYFSPAPILSLIGFALIGMGTSVIFPLAMSAAAQRTDRPSVINVAALAQTSFVVFLLGPPLLGLIAEQFGIRWSFGVGLPFVVLSFFMAGALGTRPAPKQVPAE